MLFPESNFLELGTLYGGSALAYLYGRPETVVVTYDAYPNHTKFFKEMEGLDFRLGDCRTEKFDKKYDIIFMDISHNGIDEIETMKNLESQGMIKDCMIIFDDIILNEEMKKFWESLNPAIKRDITKDGHGSGTGICIYE